MVDQFSKTVDRFGIISRTIDNLLEMVDNFSDQAFCSCVSLLLLSVIEHLMFCHLFINEEREKKDDEG